MKATRFTRKRLAACVVGLMAMLTCGVFASTSCMTSAAAEFTDDLFEQYDVVTDTAKHQTVLTGSLLGGTIANLAVVSIDEDNQRRLRLYALRNGAWVSALDAPLGRNVLFVDVANIGGRDRLLTYAPGRLNAFDPQAATERALLAVTTGITAAPNGSIRHVDVSRDVNDDGRDDLVIPDADGFWVVIQTEGGTFAEPVKIGPAFDMRRLYEADGYRHAPWDQSRIHETDYDRDGRNDLAFWNADHFEVHLQDQQGRFAPAATTFTTDVAFDSDDLTTLAAPHGVRRRRMDRNPPGALTGRVLHALTDLNGDGVADLGVFSLQGGSLWKMRSTYEVHFGAPTPDGGTAFASNVSASIHVGGVLSTMEQDDFDHDGQADMYFTTTKVGVFKAIGMIIDSVFTDSVSMDLELYRMEGGLYPGKPNAARKIRTIAFGESGARATVFPSVLVGDVDGNSRPDLLVQNGREELRVYPGVPGPNLFARRPLTVAVAMPNEEYTWMVDLNRDGKQDIVMHHAPADDGRAEPHRLTTLLAR